MMFDISLNIFTENFPGIFKLKFVNFFKTDLSQQRNSSGVVTRLRCSIKISPPLFFLQAPSISIISAFNVDSSAHLPPSTTNC